MLDLDLMAKEAAERVHRSIGQRARWAQWGLMHSVRRAMKEFAPIVREDSDEAVRQAARNDYVRAMMNHPEPMRLASYGQMMMNLEWAARDAAARGQQGVRML